MKDKKQKRNLLDDKRFLLIFSVLLAIVFWVIIAGFVSPGEDETLRNVQVNYRINEDQYMAQNLVIMNDPVQTVEVSVRGNGSVVWSLGSTDVSVYLDYSSVDGPGMYELPLLYKEIKAGSYNIVGVDPARVTLVLESLVTENFTTEAKADMVEAAEGFFKDNLVLTPATVEIQGPESEMEKIAHVVASVDNQEVRDTSIQYSGVPIRLLDDEGNELDPDNYTMSATEVEMKVPILESREIPLTVSITGQPTGFDEEWLRSIMRFSVETLHVAGESEELDKTPELEIGTIDLSTFSLGTDAYVFTLDLRKEIRNLDQIKQVTVTFDTAGLAERTFHVPAKNIRVINEATGIAIEPEDVAINVTLIGPAEVLEGLLPENILIQVDAYGVTASMGGQQSITARIVVAGSNKVFSPSSYTVLCDVHPEQPES